MQYEFSNSGLIFPLIRTTPKDSWCGTLATVESDMLSSPISLERERLMGNNANIFLAQMGQAFCSGQISASTLKTVPRTTPGVLQGMTELAGKGITTGANYGLADHLWGTKPQGCALVGKYYREFAWAGRLNRSQCKVKDYVALMDLQETLPLFFLSPSVLHISLLCGVCVYNVRSLRRQLENCLKRDHLVCANLSR